MRKHCFRVAVIQRRSRIMESQLSRGVVTHRWNYTITAADEREARQKALVLAADDVYDTTIDIVSVTWLHDMFHIGNELAASD